VVKAEVGLRDDLVTGVQTCALPILCAFTRVPIPAGQSKKISLAIPAQRFRYWNPDQKKYVIEPGDYELIISGASNDARARSTVRSEERRVGRAGSPWWWHYGC